jgi:hypothetical protein
LPKARELGEQLHRWAQRTAAPTHLLEAHEALGGTLLFLGEYAVALEQFVRVRAPEALDLNTLNRGLAAGDAGRQRAI